MLKGEKGGLIAWLALFISVISLTISFMTYTMVVGRQGLGVKVEDISKATDVLRNETANTLDRLEGLIRKSRKPEEKKKEILPQTRAKERNRR